MCNCEIAYFKPHEKWDTYLLGTVFDVDSINLQAQRALGGSALLPRPTPPVDFSTLNMNIPAVPIPGINTGREAQYAKHVKELEEELRLMRVENEKNVR